MQLLKHYVSDCLAHAVLNDSHCHINIMQAAGNNIIASSNFVVHLYWLVNALVSGGWDLHLKPVNTRNRQ